MRRVSGVRNSWLTLLKNVVLAWPISARALARSRSSAPATALAMAVPICRTIRPKKRRYASSMGHLGFLPATSTADGRSCPARSIGAISTGWPGPLRLPGSSRSTFDSIGRIVRAARATLDGPERSSRCGNTSKGLETRSGHEARFAVLDEIKGRPGDVGAKLVEDLAGKSTGVLGAVRVHGAAGQLARHLQASQGKHSLRRLAHGREDAPDHPTVVANRAVREREVRLFDVAVALEGKEEVFFPRGHAGLEDAVEHGFEERDDLLVRLVAGTPERVRMPGTHDRSVRFVVEKQELWPPADDDREARRKADAQCRREGAGPRLDGPDRRGAPVDGAHQRRHRIRIVEEVSARHSHSSLRASHSSPSASQHSFR